MPFRLLFIKVTQPATRALIVLKVPPPDSHGDALVVAESARGLERRNRGPSGRRVPGVRVTLGCALEAPRVPGARSRRGGVSGAQVGGRGAPARRATPSWSGWGTPSEVQGTQVGVLAWIGDPELEAWWGEVQTHGAGASRRSPVLWADRRTTAGPQEGVSPPPTAPAWAAASPRLVLPTSAAAAGARGSALIGRISG